MHRVLAAQMWLLRVLSLVIMVLMLGKAGTRILLQEICIYHEIYWCGSCARSAPGMAVL